MVDAQRPVRFDVGLGSGSVAAGSGSGSGSGPDPGLKSASRPVGGNVAGDADAEAGAGAGADVLGKTARATLGGRRCLAVRAGPEREQVALVNEFWDCVVGRFEVGGG